MRLTLVDWVSDTDLRGVTRGWDRLRKLGAPLQQEGDAVVFVNAAMDRFRIAIMAGGLPMVLLPPTAGKHDLLLSIFLRVSLYLRAMGQGKRAPRSVKEGKAAVAKKTLDRERRKRKLQSRKEA